MDKFCKEHLHLQSMFANEPHMKPISGLRINYRFTIKVWLTSILLGTTLFFAFKLIRDLSLSEGPHTDGISPLFYFIIALALAVILSVPSLLLFAAGYNFIAGYIYNSFRIKFTLVLIAEALCWLSFYVGFGGCPEAVIMNLDIILPYAIAIFISIIVYRLSSGFNE
ncbi:hypothetical protein SAMN06265348_110231 [Pedobacter westerhofensis]|uniref:Uncharacterized protein n=1 Tax=Pedobacter westerhofensis TaxID=425512 RepID=A0A521F6E1_9SPHI|nr:hypothetical protein [Pedobacter westerhofensis]SMO91749.1 hypothetical protein SAMN06265348_110231 [Pedobacter westerhofensis]